MAISRVFWGIYGVMAWLPPVVMVLMGKVTLGFLPIWGVLCLSFCFCCIFHQRDGFKTGVNFSLVAQISALFGVLIAQDTQFFDFSYLLLVFSSALMVSNLLFGILSEGEQKKAAWSLAFYGFWSVLLFLTFWWGYRGSLTIELKVFETGFLVISVLLLLFVKRAVWQEGEIKSAQIPLENCLKLLKNPYSFSTILCAVLPLSALICYFQMSPRLFELGGYLVEDMKIANMLLVFAFVLGLLAAPIFLKPFGKEIVIRAANILLVFAGFLYVALANETTLSPFGLTFPLILWSFGSGLVFINALLATLEKFEELRGFIIPLILLLIFVMQGLLVLLAGLSNSELRLSLGVILVISAMHISWIYFILVVGRLKQNPEDERDVKRLSYL